MTEGRQGFTVLAMDYEIPEQEARFLEIAAEHELITEAQAEQALQIAASSLPRKPVSFVLLELGHLDAPGIDLVLEAMINLVDEMVRESSDMAQNREWTGAIKRLTKAIEISPSKEDPYWRRAESLFERRLYPDALLDYTELLALTDRKGEAYNRRGVVYAKMGRYDDAIEDQLQAIAADDFNAKHHFDLGACYHACKKLEEAIACYTEALARKSNYIEALNNRAIAHLMSRDLPAAQADWEHALSIDRTRNTVRVNLESLRKHIRASQKDKD